MTTRYSPITKHIYIPQFRTADIIFIKKDNFIGKVITNVEVHTKRYKQLQKLYKHPYRHDDVLKKFSHVAVSQSDALFLETGMYTGAIQTAIDVLLNNADIVDWEVYRYCSSKPVNNNTIFHDSLLGYLDSLYNTEFFHTPERDSFFCSQLVAKVLKKNSLLAIEHTNLGPSTLYAEVKMSDDWHDVSSEYRDILFNPEYKSNKKRVLTFAKSLQAAESAHRRAAKYISIATAIARQDKSLLEESAQLSFPHKTLDVHIHFRTALLNKKITWDKNTQRCEGTLATSIMQLEAEREKIAELYMMSLELINHLDNFDELKKEL